ncbi:sulfotransferase [Erythrobacter sp. HL-111]|uniref:sulfotransferase family protein n=1 Tax=Erythrobacter sp. HL-111 TaxID=1798193 RepID=UPI0006DB91B4|nr:sulfotransferase [Erythrobacter sp. HL-111]KPP91498.1 MAG: Sulfotransferase family [Erythrobacteraceae bacterium HL-111]SDS24411.1 Sulfotransferase family protein [Erythrobacter sp. HL-111]
MRIPPRDHPLARSPVAERANALLASAWAKRRLPQPTLDPDEMWAIAARSLGREAAAAERARRDAQDVADFRERLARIAAAVREEADLNPLGRAMAHGQLVRAVRNRLRLGALWARRPELARTALAAPIIVIGHMRSGTTRIHKLLAADPAHSHTRYCDAYHPVPSRFGVNRAKSALDLALLGALNPWLQSIHPMAPARAEEELAWISAALHHSIYESQWRIPSYSAWSEARDPGAIYREFSRMLRTDAAHRGVGHLPRVMKVPAFAEDLATLLAEFPDARLVIAQRERELVLKSAVSLAANQMAVQSDNCDLAQIEALWRHKIALREARMAEALKHWRGPVARLDFDALGTDWEGEMRRTYAELGLDLTARALAAMRAEMASSERGAHRAHSDQLARFTLATG